MMDASVFGHAVNVAHRLQHSARPGTILVTESVYRRTRAQFSYLEPVRLQLRGIDQPVVAFELAGMRPDPEPLRGLSGMRTPLVGRDSEIDAVMTGLQGFTVDRSGTIVAGHRAGRDRKDPACGGGSDSTHRTLPGSAG